MAVSESGAGARLGPGSLLCEDDHTNGVCSDERESKKAPLVCPNSDVSALCTKERVRPNLLLCQDERGSRGPLGSKRGFGGSHSMSRASTN